MDNQAEKTAKTPNEKLLVQLRSRYKRATEADRDNRTLALDDIKFVDLPGYQWTQAEKDERGDRPAWEFNKLRITCKRIINDMRMNRPQGKVRGTEENDKATAEVFEGLIRNVWNVSDGDTVIDYAAEYQVKGGMAAWRVAVDYSHDTAFEQDARIVGFKNPLNVWADPAAKDPMYRDAKFWFVSSRMSKAAFEARWPNVEAVDFEASEFDDEEHDWGDEETVRLVEYWYEVPVTKTLYLMQDGRTTDQTDGTHIKERKVRSRQIKMCLATGNAILEEADYIGNEFPFVMIHGERMVIDGRTYWWGLPRHSKDSQKAYNYSRTLAVETTALAPQAKWWATPRQAKGHTEKWAEAHKKNFPYLLFNADPEQGGAPQRMPGAEVPAALIAEIQLASEDIKATTGIFDNSLGQRSNETTGVAIRQRQQQGEIVTYNFQDNLAKGIRRTWEILIDLLPKIYDTPRMVRILGADGTEKFVQLHGIDERTGDVKHDLSRGKFDVAITIGPSFATQRQEAAETYMQIAQAAPQTFAVAGDLIFRAMDLPYSEQIAERMKLTLPPAVQQMESQGKDLPPEAKAALAQAEQAMAQVAEMAQAMEDDAAKIQQEKSELVKQKADIQVATAKLQADYQRIVADLVKREAAIEVKIANARSEQEREQYRQEGERTRFEAEGAVKDVQKKADELMARMYHLLTEGQGDPPADG